MKIGIAKERRAHELRVAVSPDTVKKLIGLGAEVAIEIRRRAWALPIPTRPMPPPAPRSRRTRRPRYPMRISSSRCSGP